MISHNLILKLKARDSASVEKIKSVIAGMEGKIPVLKALKVKTDVRGAEAPYDIMMIALFDSLGDLDAYVKHPVHVVVGEKVAEAAEAIVAFRYEE